MEPFKIPKKVNRHVIKAIDFLQTFRTDFVHIEAIEDQVRRSLRHTKPVSNLDVVIKESLRKQTELGIISRSGSSMFSLTLAFHGLRSDRKPNKIKKNEGRKRTIDSLTVDEISSVRKILRGVQKPLVKTRSGVLSRALFKRKSSRNLFIRPKKASKNKTPIMCDKLENSNVPKKVNRHVFKAIRYFTNYENCEFVPLDKIKMEVKWSMKNLNPLKDLGTIIERSLTNLCDMGVLSEACGAYRLNPVQSIPADSSFVTFGKVSKYFFHEAPKPLRTDSQSSKDLGSPSSMDVDIRLRNSVFGTDPSVGNASVEPSGGPLQVPMVISEPLSQEIQGADESQNISFIKGLEKHLDNPMSNEWKCSIPQGTMQLSTYIQAEQTSPSCPIITNLRASPEVIGREPIVENAYSFALGPFQAPLVTSESPFQEIQGADESQNFSYMEGRGMHLDKPMSDDPKCSISQGRMQSSYIQAKQTSSSSPIITNFRASEGVIGREPNVENASSIEVGPFHALLVTSESVSQEIQNADKSQKSSYMEGCEMRLDEPMCDDTKCFIPQGTLQSSYIQAEQTSHSCLTSKHFRASEGVIGEVPNVENASLIELRPFHAPLVTSEYPIQEIQGANESQEIAGNLPLDVPMSDHSSSLVPITRNFSASEGLFAVEPENAPCTAFGVQLPLMAAENISTQEMHNGNTDTYNTDFESWLQSVSSESEESS